MATYTGFSTIGRTKKFKLTDYELAKADLFNHLNIRKGEKLGNANFGTIIWGMLFEPLTAEVKKAITDDLSSIISYDPRLIATSITISEYEHGLQIMLELKYVPTNQVEILKLNFDRNAVA